MNPKRLSVLATICAACILIIFCEWLYSLWEQKQILNSTVVTNSKQSQDEMPVIELKQQSEASYVDLATRPLFIKGRKPVIEPLPETILAAKSDNHAFDWRLNGIYSTPKGLSALLSSTTAKTNKNTYRKITIGADIDGWKLTEIHNDRILLEQNNVPKELLLKKSKPKESPIKPTLPIANGTPPEIPTIPPPAQATNPFNTPNNPQPEVGDEENTDNDNQ